MARSVAEWVGTTDDARAPDRVRLRVFRRYKGRCHVTGRVIRPGDVWQLDHVVALVDGGENRESNLAPVLADPHKAKTAKEVARRAKVDAIAKRHVGIAPIAAPRLIPYRPMATTVRALARRRAVAGRLAMPPARPLFRVVTAHG